MTTKKITFKKSLLLVSILFLVLISSSLIYAYVQTNTGSNLISPDQISSAVDSGLTDNTNYNSVTELKVLPSRDVLLKLNNRNEHSLLSGGIDYHQTNDHFPKTIFIVDSSSWKNVFQMSTLATWDSEHSGFVCANHFSGDKLSTYNKESRCAYPFFVVQDGDLTSLKSFINQYYKFKSKDNSPSLFVIDQSVLRTLKKQFQSSTSINSNNQGFDAKKFITQLLLSVISSSNGGSKEITFTNFSNSLSVKNQYLSVWGNKGDFFNTVNKLVVVATDSYQEGLYASYLASSLNAPLLFKDKDSLILQNIKNNTVLFVGSSDPSLTATLSSNGNKVYNLHSFVGSPVSSAFLSDLESLTNIKYSSSSENAFIVFNPEDYDSCIRTNVFSNEFLTTFGDSLSSISYGAGYNLDLKHSVFCRDSLLAPYLGIARQENLREFNSPKKLAFSGPNFVDSFFIRSYSLNPSFSGNIVKNVENTVGIQNQLKEKLYNSAYLTLLGSPFYLPYSMFSDTTSSESIATFLNPYFSNSFLLTDNNLVPGWLFGLTPTDTSALIARGLFIDSLNSTFGESKPSVFVSSVDHGAEYKDNFALHYDSDSSLENKYNVDARVLFSKSDLLHKRNPVAPLSVGDSLVFDSPEFYLNKAVIFPNQESKIDAIVSFLAKNPQVQAITLVGHTDCRASDSYNLKLSAQRSAAIKTLLEQKLSALGISVTINSVGKGESEPLHITPQLKALPQFQDASGKSYFSACTDNVLSGGCEVSGCIDKLPVSLREFAHRLNRRVEVHIDSIDKSKDLNFDFNSSLIHMPSTTGYVDVNSDIFYYFDESPQDLLLNLNPSFYRGSSIPKAPLVILDSPSSAEFSTDPEGVLKFPLALRFIRSGAKGVYGLNGKTSIANQEKFFSDVLLTKNLLAGDFSNEYFNNYVKNTNPYFCLAKEISQDSRSDSCTPNTMDSVAHKFTFIGDPLTLFTDSSKESVVSSNHPQILFVKQPQAFDVKPQDKNFSYDYTLDSSILDYTSISRRLPYVVGSDGSFEVFVLSPQKPIVSAIVYDEQLFASSFKIKQTNLGDYWVPDYNSAKLKGSFLADSCELVSSSDFGLFSSLQFNSNGDSLYKCSFSSILSSFNELNDFSTDSVFKQNQLPFKDVFVKFEAKVGPDSLSKYTTSSFRVFLGDVGYSKNDVHPISPTSKYIIENNSLSFNVETSNLSLPTDQGTSDSLSLQDEFFCKPITAKKEAYSCKIPSKLTAYVVYGGPFLSSCQVTQKIVGSNLVDMSLLPSQAVKNSGKHLLKDSVSFSADASKVLTPNVLTHLLAPNNLYSSLTSVFIGFTIDYNECTCLSTSPLSACSCSPDHLQKKIVPRGFHIESDMEKIKSSFCSINPYVNLKSDAKLIGMPDDLIPVQRFYVPLVDALGKSSLKHLSYAPEKVPSI